MQASTTAFGIRSRIFLLAIAVLPTLTACGQPFVDSRRDAGRTERVGPSSPDHPVICYSKSETSPAQVLAMATEVCAQTNRVPRFDREKALDCRLLQPWRAHFTCVKPGSPRANTAPPGGNIWADTDQTTEPRSAGTRQGAAGAGSSSTTTTPSVTSPTVSDDDWSGSIYPEGKLPDPPKL